MKRIVTALGGSPAFSGYATVAGKATEVGIEDAAAKSKAAAMNAKAEEMDLLTRYRAVAV